MFRNKTVAGNPSKIQKKNEIIYGIKDNDMFEGDKYKHLDLDILNKSIQKSSFKSYTIHNNKVKKKRPWYDYLIIPNNNFVKVYIWDIWISILVGYSTITSSFYVAFSSPNEG